MRRHPGDQPLPKKNNIYSIYAIADQLDNSYICNCDNYFADNPFFPYEYDAFHATVRMDNSAQELLVRSNESGRITGRLQRREGRRRTVHLWPRLF